MLLNCGAEEDSWELLGQQGDQTSPSGLIKVNQTRKTTLNIHWKDWCWSWSSNTLTTWCEELPHWKRPWCWARLRAGGERDDRGWDHQFNGHEFEQTPRNSEGQGSLACCSPWSHKESDTTEWLNNNDMLRQKRVLQPRAVWPPSFLEAKNALQGAHRAIGNGTDTPSGLPTSDPHTGPTQDIPEGLQPLLL